MKKNRFLVVLGMVIAGLCLFRVFSVAANDDVEVYSSREGQDANDTDQAADDERLEIRLSTPEESAKRIDDEGYPQVPGAERLKTTQWAAQDEILVPKRAGRTIAADLPQSPIPTREAARGIATESGESVTGSELSDSVRTREVAPSSDKPSVGTLETQAIEPKPFMGTSRESGVPLAQNYGLQTEPRFETRVDSPVPQYYADKGLETNSRVGVQEISLIASDYGFFPKRIFVTQNIPVKIYLSTTSKVTLCFLQDNWGIKKGITPGKIEEITFLPRDSGDYRFHCPVKSIEGTLTVRESPVANTSTRGLANELLPPDRTGRHNEPVNAGQLRALIED